MRNPPCKSEGVTTTAKLDFEILNEELDITIVRTKKKHNLGDH